MARIPIACTLSADDGQTRAREWRAFLSENVLDASVNESTARFQLRDGGDVLLAAADLARREKLCCSFFEFSLLPLPEGTWLVVAAPEEARGVLDDMIEVVAGSAAPERP